MGDMLLSTPSLRLGRHSCVLRGHSTSLPSIPCIERTSGRVRPAIGTTRRPISLRISVSKSASATMATGAEKSYEKIQELVKAKPELGSTAAEKLAAIVESLEDLGADQTGSKEPEDTFDKLIHGFKNFKKNVYDKHPELTHSLKSGQWPKFMVVACADSRVDPVTLLGFKPGDAFVIRNVANMCPPFEEEGYPSFGSAVEYAVLHLKVQHILVIGHRACGGVNALVRMVPEDANYSTTFIERWVAIGKPTRKEVKASSPHEPVEAVVHTCEKESVNNSLANLLTYPFVVDALKDKKVSLHGGYYDHIEGSFATWDFKSKNEEKVY